MCEHAHTPMEEAAVRCAKGDREENMATGLYVMPEGTVMVAYGGRKLPIPAAQYKANGYKPALEKLVTMSPDAIIRPVRLAVLPSRSPAHLSMPAPEIRGATNDADQRSRHL